MDTELFRKYPLRVRTVSAGATTAQQGELIRVTATSGVSIFAVNPAQLRDGDYFGVVYDVQGFNIPRVTIDANGTDFAALGVNEDQWFILPGSYAIFVYSNIDNLWHHVAASKVPKIARPASAYRVRGQTVDGTITPAVVWRVSRNSVGIRWKVRISAAEHVADEIAQFLIDATFYRQSTGLVIDKNVIYIDGPLKDPGLVNVDVDFSILSPDITMRVTGDAGLTIDWDIEGEVWEF